MGKETDTFTNEFPTDENAGGTLFDEGTDFQEESFLDQETEDLIRSIENESDQEDTDISAEQEVDKAELDEMPFQKALEYAPKEVVKSYKNLQSAYTKTSQDNKALLKRIEELEKSIATQQKTLFDSGYFEELDQKIDKHKDAEEWTPEWQEKKMAETFKKMYQPLLDSHKQEIQRSRLERFVAENPDLKTNPDIYNGVKEVLKSKPGLSTEEAYYLVKGKMSIAQRTQAEVERKEKGNNLKKISAGSGSKGKATPPPNLSAYEFMQWAEENGYSYED